jgi:hypothetical protein
MIKDEILTTEELLNALGEVYTKGVNARKALSLEKKNKRDDFFCSTYSGACKQKDLSNPVHDKKIREVLESYMRKLNNNPYLSIENSKSELKDLKCLLNNHFSKYEGFEWGDVIYCFQSHVWKINYAALERLDKIGKKQS